MGGTTAKSCLIERRRAGAHEHVRGRPHLPVQEGLRVPGVGAVGRPRRDRRRRRQPRPRRRARPAQGRARVSGRRPRPGVLRARRHRAGRHRRRPRCSACSTPTSSSAATCRSTRAARRRRSARSPTPLGLPVDDTAAGIHELVNQNMAAAARMHAVEQGVDLRGVTRARLRRRRPGARLRRRRAARVAAGRLPGQRQRAVGVRHARHAGAHRPRPLHGPPARRRRRRPSATRCSTSCAPRAAGCSPRPASPRPRSASATASTPATSARATRSRSGSARATSGRRTLRRRRRARSRREYRRIYGLTIPDVGVEAVTWRLSAFAAADAGRAAGRRSATGTGDAARHPRRCASAAATPPVDTPVYRRADLGVGQRIDGPGDRRGARDDRGRSARAGRSTVAADGSLIADAGAGVSVRSFDPIELEVLWQSLIATVNEQARALQRAAFSPDRARGGRPRQRRVRPPRPDGRAGRHRHARPHQLARPRRVGDPRRVPARLAGRGRRADHQRPVQDGGPAARRHGAVPGVPRTAGSIAFFGSTIHHTDVGGYGIGAGARDVFEEGLWIPICKLMIAGERNDDVWKFILSNVRQPDHMAGDLHAQMATGEVGAQRLLHAVRRATASTTSRTLADEIIERSEAATRASDPRAAGRHVPRRSAVLDLADGSTIDIVCAITVDAEAGEITRRLRRLVAAPARTGINVVKNYTHAYTTFTVRSVLNPELPNNHGSLAPIKVEAPGGHRSSTPCRRSRARPATSSGMFLPNALLKALAQIKPEQAMAEGRARCGRCRSAATTTTARPFITAMFTYAGGVGARATKPGLVGVLVPDRRRRRAGRGRRGVGADPLPAQGAAPGQRRRRARRPAGSARRSSSPSTRRGRGSSTPSRRASRDAPQGIFGGEAGRVGSFTVNGEPVATQARVTLQPGDHRAPRPARRRRLRRAGRPMPAAAADGDRRGRRCARSTAWLAALGRAARPGHDRSSSSRARRRASTTWTYGEFDAVVGAGGAGCCVVTASVPGSSVHLALDQLAGVRRGVAGDGAPRRVDRPVRPDGLDAGAGRAHRAHPARSSGSARRPRPTCTAPARRRRCRSSRSTRPTATSSCSARDAVETWPAPEPRDRAAVMFTSGTTGRPKGVEITQANYAFAGDDDGARPPACEARPPPARRAAAVPRQRAVLHLRLGDLGRRVGGADAHVLGERRSSRRPPATRPRTPACSPRRSG